MELNYIDVTESKDEIFAWSRDKNNNLTLDTFPISDFAYCFAPDNTGKATHQNIYGVPMKKVSFDSKWDLRNYAKNRDNLCESDVRITYKAILDLFSEGNPDAPINVGFYDIEVDFNLRDGKGYPKPNNPHGEINSISLYDAGKQRYVMIMPAHLKGKFTLEDKDCPVEHVWCFNERSMLSEFARYIDDIDLLTGWFSAGYDLPYIMERAFINFDRETALEMFCRDGFKATSREVFQKNTQSMRIEWDLVGRQHVDMLELFKKFFPGQRDSWKLDSICQEELNQSKVQYEDEGDLGNLYRNEPKKFYEYSLHDSRLLKMLDDKFQIMALATMLARSSCVKFSDVTGAVKPIEHQFIKFCRNKGNYVLPDKKDNKKTKFPGAIVYDTVSGVNSWVFSIDLTALYPSCMIMLGLSPETMVFQALGEYEDYLKMVTESDEIIQVEDVETGDVFEISAKEFKDQVYENDMTLSANGTVFNGKLGLLSEWVKKVFEDRKKEKGLAAEMKKAGRDEEARSHDLTQKVLKILANSTYGCAGNVFFRLFDLRMAKSITQTGRLVSRFQAMKSNDILEEMEAAA